MGTKKSDRPKKARADDLLVERGLATTRREAQAIIMTGKIVIGDQRVNKPAQLVDPALEIRMKDQRRFVSRGGEKLAGVIEELGLEQEFVDKVVLDIGASTGGFTQCLLELGAKQVIAVDVGSNQLAWSLRVDPRVVCLEKTDIRSFDPGSFAAIEWVVADISFNSLAQLVDAIVQSGGPNCRYLLMVKPQFELAASEVPTGGVVHDAKLRAAALQKVKKSFEAKGLQVIRSLDSPVLGRAGNQETFLYLAASTKSS